MSFAIPADSYDRFMGRYSMPLAHEFADFAGVENGQSVIDVGCGPGALTGELITRLGPASVSAVDPSESFVTAARERYPLVDVRRAAAEAIPYEDRAFDAALAQLVVHFMTDPVAGLSEMARVTRKGGTVAACVWDHSGDRGPLSLFWEAAHQLDPNVGGEANLPGAHQGDLRQLFDSAGLGDIEEDAVSVDVQHPTFDEWWEPFTLGVGPAGVYTRGLDVEHQAQLRDRCREMQPAAPFVVTASAWAARGRV